MFESEVRFGGDHQKKMRFCGERGEVVWRTLGEREVVWRKR